LQPEVLEAATNGAVAATAADFATLGKLEEEVRNYTKKASRATYASGGNRYVNRLKSFAEALIAKLVEYGKKALDIALHKFVIELCAMVISSLFAALARKGYGTMDISTGDVYYRNGSGAGSTKPVSAQPTTDTRNPFADWSGRTASAW
jgi:hypothetical protein